jgi:hypothetical protein
MVERCGLGMYLAGRVSFTGHFFMGGAQIDPSAWISTACMPERMEASTANRLSDRIADSTVYGELPGFMANDVISKELALR